MKSIIFKNRPRKAQKANRQLPKQGSYFVIDAANLLRTTGMQHAAVVLGAVVDEVKSQGYRCSVLCEERVFNQTRNNQSTAQDVALLDAFARREDFVLVKEAADPELKSESDDVGLQMCEVLLGALLLTNDNCLDYQGIHPDVVPSRLRGFTVVKLEDRMLIIVHGLKRPIVIPTSDWTTSLAKPSVDASRQAAPAVRRTSARRVARSAAKPSPKGRGEACCDECFDDRWEQDGGDQEKRRAASALRDCRRRKEDMREGRFHHRSHFSAARRTAAALAALAFVSRRAA